MRYQPSMMAWKHRASDFRMTNTPLRFRRPCRRPSLRLRLPHQLPLELYHVTLNLDGPSRVLKQSAAVVLG